MGNGNTENDSGTGFRWSFLKVPIQWVTKKACEDWIRGIIKETVEEGKEGIISSSITVQRLQAYDEVYDNFSKSLSYAIGRYFEHRKEPNLYYEVHVMKQVNEVRQSRLRFLKICGPKIQSYFQEEGTDWLNDPESFNRKAQKVENIVGQLVSEDRQWVEKSGRRP